MGKQQQLGMRLIHWQVPQCNQRVDKLGYASIASSISFNFSIFSSDS